MRTTFFDTFRGLALGTFLAGLLLPASTLAADNYFFTTGTSPNAGVTYSSNSSTSNNVLHFNILARTGVATDLTYNSVVTIGLYDTATSLPAQTGAVYVPLPPASSSTPVTAAVVPMTFTAGKLNLAVTLSSGTDSMQVSIGSSDVPSGNTYPGTLGNTSGPGYVVQGYSNTSYFETASGDITSVDYSPGLPVVADKLLLALDPFFNQANNYGVTLAQSGGVTGSNCFAVTAVSAGFAAGGAKITNNFYLYRQSGTSAVTVTYQVILDYNGNLADFNTPNLAEDTVWQGAATISSGQVGFANRAAAGGITFFAGVPFAPFMSNGQIAVRAWCATQPSNNGFLVVADTSVSGLFSSLTIPYSSQNTSPVKATLSPSAVLAGSSGAPLTYVVKNQYSSPISYFSFGIPPNSSGGTYWNLGVPGSLPGHGGSLSAVQPAASTPGTVIFDSAGGSPIALGESVTILVTANCSSESANWTFPLLTALTGAAVVAPVDSASAVIETLGTPAPPTGFTADVSPYVNSGGHSVSLYWTQPSSNENPTGYILSGSPNGPITVNNFNTTSYVDILLTNLTGYNYSIKTINQVTESGTASANPSPVTAFANPGAPTGLQAYTGAATLQLRWNAPVSVAGSYAVTGYQVWRGTSSGTETALTQVPGGSTPVTFNDTTFSPGVQNYYYVSALDSQYSSGTTLSPHHGGRSSEASGFPPGNPPTGLGVVLTQGPDTLNLSWSAPSNVLNLPLAGYDIYRQVNGGGFGGSPYASVSGSTLTYGDTAVFTGQIYQYYVVARDSLSVVSNSSTTITGQVGPSAPANIAASASAAGITVTWDPNNAPENVVNYVIFRSPGSSSATGGATIFIDNTVAGGTDYSYYVQAVNSNGVTGPNSVTITSAKLPAALTGLAVVPDPSAPTTLDLNWNATSEANLTGYRLIRGTTNAFPPAAPATFSLGLVTSYVDNALSSGTTYFYFLQGVNIGGAGLPVTAGRQVPPLPPASPSASTSSAAVTLNWTSAPLSQVVTSYTVYARDMNPPGSFALLGTSATNKYTDSAALAGHDYQYYVTATNSGTTGPPVALGGEGLASVTITSAKVPAAISGFTVMPQAGAPTTLNLGWTASSEANLTGYRLVRGTNNPPTLPVTFNLGLVTSYVDNALSSGTTYFYFLSGLNVGGVGAPVTAGQQVPPLPPGTPTAVPSVNSIVLNWNASPSTQIVSSYKIYGRDASGGGFTLLGTSAAPGFSYSPVSQGHDYLFYLTAANSGTTGPPVSPGGEGLASTTITSGPLPVPASGLTVAGISASNGITVSWNNVTSTVANASSLDLVWNNTNSLSGATTVHLTPATTISYPDLGKTPDGTYYYWLQTNNTYGSSTLTNPVSQLAYPAAPTLNSAVLGADNISAVLNWSAVGSGDVSGYRIYRQLNSGAFQAMTVVGPSLAGSPATFTFPVQNGQTYGFRVTAINATGEGPSSNSLSIVSGPSMPTGLTAQSGLGPSTPQVGLIWNANPSSESVTGYGVYRTSGPASVLGGYTLLNKGAGTSYTDNSAADGQVYAYLITAIGGGVESLQNTALAASVVAYRLPNAPGSPSAVPGNGQVACGWALPSVTTYPLSSVKVYRSTSAGVTGSPVTTLASTFSSFTDTGLTNGVTYFYFYQTLDSQGNGSFMSSPQVSAQPLVAPGPPQNLLAASGDQLIQITWNPAAPGTLPLGGYLVYRLDPGPSLTLLATPGPSVTGYQDTGLTNGASVTYVIRAVDSSAVTTGLHASSPVTVSQSSGNGLVNPPDNVAAVGGNAQVNVTWNDSVLIPAGAVVANYDLYRSSTPGGASGYSIIANLPFGTTSKLDTSLANGTTYYYYLVANSNVSTASSASATVFATAARPPNAPAAPLAADGNAQVTLTWSSAGVVLDNIPVTQYVVYRDAAAAATVYNTLTYTDSAGVNNGTPYSYQVLAVNANGLSSALSPAVNGHPYAPFTPTGLASSASTVDVTLTWTPASSPSWPVTQFAWVRTPYGGSSAATFFAAASPAIDTTAALAQLYIYQVFAFDDQGHTSAFSAPVTDGRANTPSAPTTLLAGAGDSQILVDWPASAPVSGAMPVSYYVLQGSDGVSQVIPATQTWFLDGPLSDPATVSYTVYAVDISGQASSPVHVSTTALSTAATTDSTYLNPPTALAVTLAGNGSLKLTWTPPNDMGRLVTSYNIYRAGSFSTSGGSRIASVANPPSAPATTFTDTNLAGNSTFYYVVRAVYAPGSTESPNSNHGVGTTGQPASPIPPVVEGQMAFDANLFLPAAGQKLGIYYNVPNSGVVELDVYNVSGRLVTTLVPGYTQAGTLQSVFWDGKDRNGKTVASGLYLIEIRATGFHQVKKVAVVK